MQILARAVGRRKEAVAQVQIVKGSGLFVINDKPAEQYLQNNSCSLISVKSPFLLCQLLETTLLDKRSGGLRGSSSLPPALPLATKDGNTAMAVSPLPLVPHSKGDENSLFSFDQVDTIVKVKGGGLIGQADAIKLAVSRAICNITDLRSVHNSNTIKSVEKLDSNSTDPRESAVNSTDLVLENQTGLDSLSSLEKMGLDALESNNLDNVFKKQLKTKGYLTQDSRVKERRKYGLKKARKASQYHKR